MSNGPKTDPRTADARPVCEWCDGKGVIGSRPCHVCVAPIPPRSADAQPERIEPEERQPAPNLSWCGPYGSIWSARGTPHHGICGCSECAALKRSHPITVVPFAVLDPAMRAKGEPTAVLEYGGVRIEIGHTFLRSLAGALAADVAKSFYGESLAVTVAAIEEIIRRMWRSYEENAG